MSLSAAVWLQFAMQVFEGGTVNYHYIGNSVVTCITFLAFWHRQHNVKTS